jgi:catechol 2,3-dioxygenase
MTAIQDSPLRIGRIAFTVRDLDRVSLFYQRALGLRLLEADEERVRLGAGSTVLLELRRDRHARVRPGRDAGLYHVAFLLPGRADLARFYRHAVAQRLAIGASDHLVSESIYCLDPERNGVELCADRPPSAWQWSGNAVAMSVDRLDIADLLDSDDGQAWQGMPDGTVIGHLNLQVGGLPAADAFYRDLLGFNITCTLPGARFFASGGYHHHLAANTWTSSGAGARPDRVLGLADINLIAADSSVLGSIRSRVPPADRLEDTPGCVRLRDPWGTPVSVEYSLC